MPVVAPIPPSEWCARPTTLSYLILNLLRCICGATFVLLCTIQLAFTNCCHYPDHPNKNTTPNVQSKYDPKNIMSYVDSKIIMSYVNPKHIICIMLILNI